MTETSAVANEPLVYRPMRPLSRALSRLIAETWITPNMITFGWILGFVAASILLGVGSPLSVRLAALLIAFSYFLDCLDGDLARAAGKGTREGGFLEQVGHWFCNGLLIVGAIYGGDFHEYKDYQMLVLGAALVGDHMFHLSYLIINMTYDRAKNYGLLHNITAILYPAMPLNMNLILIASAVGVPIVGVLVWTVLSNMVWIYAVCVVILRGL